MKKSIKEKNKTKSSSSKKKVARSLNAKQPGYKEKVFNSEEQKNYEKSNLSKKNKKNTSGPE